MGRSFIAGVSAALAAAVVVAATVVVGAPVALVAQAGGSASEQALRSAITTRYDVTLLRSGVLLTPKDRRAGHTVEVAGGTVAVDGIDVSGAELRRQLGGDADAIMQLTYLDVIVQRQLFSAGAQATPTERPGAQTGAPSPREQREGVEGRRAEEPRRGRRTGGIVRFGRDVTIAEDEVVSDDVVVIGASAKIDGEVQGDVVVVGGQAQLVARAHLHRDLTVVGGTLERHADAVVEGDVNEVGTGAAVFGGRRGGDGAMGRGGRLLRRGGASRPFARGRSPAWPGRSCDSARCSSWRRSSSWWPDVPWSALASAPSASR